MQLLTAPLITAFQRFPIHAQDGRGDDAVVVCKFFDPTGRYTLYVTEGEPILAGGAPSRLADGTPNWEFFGYCLSPLGEDCDEWGYVTLEELHYLRGRFGLGIERDTSVVPGERTVGSFLRRVSSSARPLP